MQINYEELIMRIKRFSTFTRLGIALIAFAFVSAAMAIEPAATEKDNQEKLWEFVIPCQYDGAWVFQEGLARPCPKRVLAYFL